MLNAIIQTNNKYIMYILGSRIIDGQPAIVGQFPWQVAVFFQVGTGTFFCGGSILSNNWILTAAHCALGASQFTLYFGGITLDNFESGREQRVTTTAIVHPGYSSATLNNDIALIRIDNPIQFNDRIQPISMPARGDVTGAGVTVTVSGWGRTSDTIPSISNILNYVSLTTISNAQCAAVYGSQVIISSTICAVGNPHHSTCNGDSGGPLIDVSGGSLRQVGVVSFVSSAGCASGHPSGYVRTESFLDWIAQNTGLNVKAVPWRDAPSLLKGNRIIGGSPAVEAQIPYQVALIAGSADGAWLCGGSLISTEWVLTAAHCVLGLILSVFTIFIYFISIFLAEGGASTYLNYVNVEAISNEDCALVYGDAVVVDSTLCTRGMTNEGVCSGDSGGPLVSYDYDDIEESYNVTATLQGVVSFTAAVGCEAGFPSGFVRVTELLDWIRDNTGL
ncbi:chymotrypsin-related [Holotrichia oblita]|uniref:Chymotrypsin-related n=1 Tax=Holotrichia oblita TaxID=644536 RepID=A0ACB9TGI9_HOLOL|nr:chymotrypsin-related [Holotrichia oblita]